MVCLNETIKKTKHFFIRNRLSEFGHMYCILQNISFKFVKLNRQKLKSLLYIKNTRL